jgi:hypothetical protein
VENLNVCTRHGCSPHFFHVVLTVKLLTPRCLANNRLDQCVTPRFSGGGSNVANTIATGSMTAGRPDFDRSSNPAMPSAANRRFQPITAGLLNPTRRTISPVPTPSAVSSTTLARCAKPARIDGDRVHDSNSSRSRDDSSTLTVNGMRHDPTR